MKQNLHDKAVRNNDCLLCSLYRPFPEVNDPTPTKFEQGILQVRLKFIITRKRICINDTSRLLQNNMRMSFLASSKNARPIKTTFTTPAYYIL